MVSRRRMEGEDVSLSEMVNKRVDEELEGFDRAFERLEALKAQEQKDEEQRQAEKEPYLA